MDVTAENIATDFQVSREDQDAPAAESHRRAAAAVVLASESFVNRNGFTPLGRLIGYGLAGVEPRIMGMRPVPATGVSLRACRSGDWGQPWRFPGAGCTWPRARRGRGRRS
jgi:acetyl-CoA acetyltransferase